MLEGGGGGTKCVNPHRIFRLFIMISLCSHTHTQSHTHMQTQTHVHKGGRRGICCDRGIKKAEERQRDREKAALRHTRFTYAQ